MTGIRVAMLNNIPSPYSVDLFRCLQNQYPETEFHFIFTSASEDNRNWKTDFSDLKHAYVLKSRIIRLKTVFDQRYVHLPANIRKTLDRINPDVVIAKEYNPSALQSLSWCRKHKKKYIHVTEGTLNSEKKLNPVQKLSRKRIIAGSDYLIGASTKSKEKLLAWKAPEEKTDICWLTFDFSRMQKIERRPVRGCLLYVGSMAERKGIDLLIRALPYLKTDYTLNIVGNGTPEQESALKKLAEDLGVSGRIRWCGYLEGDELYRKYSEAEVFVLPTREDCFGMVLLEALIMGIPIVSSKYADGAYDIVDEGVNGCLADPFRPEEFAGAIGRVMNSEEIQKNAGTMNYDRFRLENVAKAYMKAVRSVLS
ncbi:MAG: glycosyltransferase family 4 protein [Solobacterium sp.]|nr:glycosyltransferase family 4 protein [Solobacterium sp.]